MKTAILFAALLLVNASTLFAQQATKPAGADTAKVSSTASASNSSETTPVQQAPLKPESAPQTPNSIPGDVAVADGTPDQRIDLLGADLTRNWKAFSSKPGVAFSDVWRLVSVEKERHLVCVGEPKGFLYTLQRFDNFELIFEWKYSSDPSGNSGVLIFTNDEPRLWPTSMQIQLHQPRAGSIFPSGDATSDSTTEATDLALEIGTWNKCRITAVGGRVSVEINGKPAGEVSGCKPLIGSIALQSEGSETHFRRMLLRKLPAPAEVAPTEVAPASPTNAASPAAVDSSPKDDSKKSLPDPVAGK